MPKWFQATKGCGERFLYENFPCIKKHRLKTFHSEGAEKKENPRLSTIARDCKGQRYF